MVYVTQSVGVFRGKPRSSRARMAAFVVSGLLAAMAAGALLALLGRATQDFVPDLALVIVGCVAIAIGLAEALGKNVWLAQRDCETPRRWLAFGPLWSAGLNGAAMGTGIVSRLGSWSWYAVPLGAFLAADPYTAALIFGAYGGTRAVCVIALSSALRSAGPAVAGWLIDRAGLARRTTGVAVIVVGIVLLEIP